MLLLLVPGCPDSHGVDDDTGAVRDTGPTDTLFMPDAPIAPDALAPDVPTGVNAGPTGTCAADDARAERCPMFLCDGPPSWHWNGDSCFMIDCGACRGADCERRFSSQEDCERAHATCAAALCRATGGEWLFWAEECGHRLCGNPTLSSCEVGMPVCDCGPYQTFDETRGCVDPTPLCGELPMRSREALCRGTGGTWAGTCCDTECGVPCPLPCASPACTCGPLQIFDERRGCVEATRCFERRAGETCGLPQQRCIELGQFCEIPCDGPGCVGTCEHPVCPF